MTMLLTVALDRYALIFIYRVHINKNSLNDFVRGVSDRLMLIFPSPSICLSANQFINFDFCRVVNTQNVNGIYFIW